MPTPISTGVSSNLGVTARILRSPALMKPVYSATPSPSIATSTTPSGGKVTKVLTIFAMKSVRAAGASRFLISIGAPVRGSMSLKTRPDMAQEVAHTTASSNANRMAGSGSLLPATSIQFRTRFNPRGLAPVACAVIVAFA